MSGLHLGDPFTTRLPHAAAVPFVGFLHESRRLLTVDSDGLIRIWELSPAARASWPSRRYTWSSEFSPDGRRILLASGAASPPETGHATVLDAVTGEVLLPPLRHGGQVRFATYRSDGSLIVTTSRDGTARLWDASTGEPVSGELRHASDPLRHSFFSPDGHRLLTFGLRTPSSSNATLWEVPSGRRLATLPETESAFTGAFSANGEHFVTVTDMSRRVQLWRTADGQPVGGAAWSPYNAAAFVSNSRLAIAGTSTLETRGLDGTSTVARVAIPQAEGIVVTKDGTALVVPTGTGAIHVVRASDLSPRFPPCACAAQSPRRK